MQNTMVQGFIKLPKAASGHTSLNKYVEGEIRSVTKNSNMVAKIILNNLYITKWEVAK